MFTDDARTEVSQPDDASSESASLLPASPEPASPALKPSPCKKLRQDVKRWRNIAYRHKVRAQNKITHVTETNIFSQLSKVFKGRALHFVKTQIRLSSRQNRGVRWTAKDKSLAFWLYHVSPKAYQLLKKVFKLRTVQQKLMPEFQQLPLPLGCSSEKLCCIKERVLSLFLKIRLHFTLKDNSREFSTSMGKRNRKVIALSHQ